MKPLRRFESENEFEYLRMHRIAGAREERAVNSLRLHFRSQAAMHKPLLKPDSFQRARRNFTQERRDVWSTKRAEADLARIAVVGIAVVERRACARENQKRLKVRLEQHVDVYPLSDVTTVAHVAWHRIESIRPVDAMPRWTASHVSKSVM